MEFFVPVTLVNPLNARQHWAWTSRRARKQRDAVASTVLLVLGHTWRVTANLVSRPKCVRFDAYVGRAFDDDGLIAALKHVRDGLRDVGLIADDGPQHGHVFTYHQHPATPRFARGVRIAVSLRHAAKLRLPSV